MIIFNQGNTPDREGLIVADATSVDEPIPGAPGPVTHNIPVVGASFADGSALAQPGSTAFVDVDPAEPGRLQRDRGARGQKRRQRRHGRRPSRQRHRGTGHQRQRLRLGGAPGDGADDGQGQAAEHRAVRVVGREEQGLVGSTDYVEGLSQAERDRIALYLNYDMVGSPNYIFMVYDADESSFPAPEGVPIPPGSTAIEDLYESYYTLIGEPYDDTAFDGRSDYQAFIVAGIPAGGLFTGAEELKTERAGGHLGGHGRGAVRPLLPRGV